MPDNRDHNRRFEPIHDSHAIDQVLFGLQFANPIGDDALLKVRNTAEQFKTDLPGRIEMSNVTLAIGVPTPVSAVPPSSAGIMFSKSRPDGTIESEIRLERASVTFRTTSYTRWNAVWADARRYFEAIIPIYAAEAGILGVSLNFVDKFSWVGAISECRPNLLLRERSSYLCPHVFSAVDLWHSHTGAFLRIDSATKRLLNINADCVDESRSDGLRRVVVITTVLTDLMNQPGFDPFSMAPGNAGEHLHDRMSQLHAHSKQVFGDVINDEMSKRIALVN